VAKSDKSGRKERLAAALRENLKRRKARERALDDGKTVGAGAKRANPPDSDPGKAKKSN